MCSTNFSENWEFLASGDVCGNLIIWQPFHKKSEYLQYMPNINNGSAVSAIAWEDFSSNRLLIGSDGQRPCVQLINWREELLHDQILDKKLLGKNMVKKIYWRNGSIVVGLCGGRYNFGFMKVKNRKLCALHSNPKVNKEDMLFDFVMGDRGVILSMGWGDHSNFFPLKKTSWR